VNRLNALVGAFKATTEIVVENARLTPAESAKRYPELWALARVREAEAYYSGFDFTLTIHPIVEGFRETRGLRRSDPQLPCVGTHRLLSASAVRQGLAYPTLSGLFPTSLWDRFPTPIRHFLLQAGELAARQSCPVAYPNIPTRDDMNRLHRAAIAVEDLHGFNREEHAIPLQRLGWYDLIGPAIPPGTIPRAEGVEPLARGGAPWDWTGPISEMRSALYSEDIEQSLHLQNILDLYPLHKRVLGLLEYALVPDLKGRLKDKPLSEKAKQKLKGASGLWTAAFTGWKDEHSGSAFHREGCLSPPLSLDRDLAASIEVEGHWLIEAQQQQNVGATSLDLADLLDCLVRDISTAPEVKGTRSLDGKTLTLTPDNPAEQAQQLASLRDRGIATAACMTLFLGKIILSLRNYIEHGHDEVDGACLKIDGSHYWQQERQGKPTYQWVLDTAAPTAISWRNMRLLPTTPDPPAPVNALLLTPASLHRCLVLLALVLGAGRSHLQV
jgi:hypothetical protein